MTDRKWTPGPWDYDPDDPHSHDIYSARGFHIGRATSALGEMGTESEANARLWAAAPELYEALEAARFYLSHHYDDDTLSNVDAALAKARGEQ